MGTQFPSLALLVLLLALCTTVANGAPCTNIMPGLERQARGVDITKLDLIPIDPVQSGGGFMSQVLQHTCDKGTTRTIGDVTYAVPDNVRTINTIPSGSVTASAHVLKTSNEVRKSFSVNAGVDVTTAKFGFSSSFSYSKTQTTLLKNERKVSTVSAAFVSRRVDLVPQNELVLGQRAQAAINALPARFVDGRAAYENFLRQYGTHYIQEAKFGGIMSIYMETESQYFEKTTTEAVSAQASATFGSILKIKGGYSSSTTNIDSKFTSATTNTVRYYGGSANLMDQNGLATWMPTIKGDPWIYSTKLNRISDLVRDATKRQALSDAIDDYVMRSYVNVELRRVLDTLPTGVRWNKCATKLKNRINTMLNKFPLVQSDVESLGKDVMSTYARLFVQNDYSKEMYFAADMNPDFVCPAGQAIQAIKSAPFMFNFIYQRRAWKWFWGFKCAYLPMLYTLGNCEWRAPDYSVSRPTFSCGTNNVIKGVKGEGRFQYKCCDILDADRQFRCSWTSYYNQPLDFGVAAGLRFLKGVKHDGTPPNAGYAFEVCSI